MAWCRFHERELLMPQVLTTNGLILCPHGGKGTTTPMHPKWQINGGTVLVEGDSGFLACPFFQCPCTSYQLQSMGLNATEIDGQKVILVTDFNHSSTGLPLLMADFHQTFDESTPAPVPAGQPAPPASAALADFSSPVVMASPPLIPFSVSLTQVPVTVTFTMTTAHPLCWILMLIDEATGESKELTNGVPGATVQPWGGKWTVPSQTIVVTLTPFFIQSLGPPPTKHHLFLTGVSRRGFSGHAEAIIVVSP
jgi:hypothetical protein